MSFPVFSDSEPIKSGDIFSSLLNQEPDQDSNCAEKFKALLERGIQLYTKSATLKD